MSCENDWLDYHLTPSGWVEGSKTIGHFGQIEEREEPPNFVQTIRFRTYQSSSFSRTDYWYEIKYETNDQLELKKLIERFGPLPDGYKHWTLGRP